MSGKYKEALEYVEEMLDSEKTIEYGDNDLIVTVNEEVDIQDVYNAIINIVDNIVEREFEYELMDLMLPYYWISLFTDINVPTLFDDDGEEYPDYVQCYKIATCLNLEYELTQVSPLVAGYIYMIPQNIWRRLEYHKSHGAYLQKELTDALSAFYEIMDELDELNKQQADIDVEGFMEQLNEISTALQELNNEKSADIIDMPARSSN